MPLIDSIDPSDLANAARCFSSCIPPGMQMAVRTYLINNVVIKAQPPCVTPTAPQPGRAAIALSNTIIQVNWKQALNAGTLITGYIVYWGTTSGGPYTFNSGVVPSFPKTYNATGLTPGTTYYFVIQALTGINGCVSANSSEISATTTGQVPNGLLNNLVHYYRLQEAVSTFADIGSGTNTPLSWTNAGQDFTQVAGHVEPFAGNYDGSNGFNCLGTLGIGAPADMGGGAIGSNPTTFALWFKPSNVQPNNARTVVIAGVWDNDTAAGQECWVLVLNAADNTKVQLFCRDFPQALKFTATVGTLTLNAWNFVCGGWDSGSNVCWVSVNGAARVTAAMTSLNTTVGGARFNIANMFGPQRECQMSFESIGIWQRNFTATDISNLYNGGAGLPYAQFTA